MRCKVCKEKACIKIKRQSLSLCPTHFLERFELESQRLIKKYKMFTYSDKVAVAVSGGKDSLSLLYLLNKLGYNILGIHINLGIFKENYSNKSEIFVRNFRDKFNIPILIYNVKENQEKGIEDIVKERWKDKPCAVCGMVKRYLMNILALKNNCTVLATGHNLDDESSRLFGNIIYWQEEHLEHQELTLPEENGLLKKVKPFFLFTEKEIALYAILNRIDYIKDECPYSVGAKTLKYKGILNLLENDSPGTKYRFLTGFYNFKKKIDKKGLKTFKGTNKCIQCGMPTKREICTFCTTFEKHPFKIFLNVNK
ncbi:MAG: TIGR00269 family protein [Candidatus Hydrothermales bacterium]